MYLGIDLGTSGLKALLCDGAGTVLAEARAGYDADVPGPGLSEQDPQVWAQAMRSAVRELRARVPAVTIDLRCIGLSGQMHGLLALGADDAPYVPRSCGTTHAGQTGRLTLRLKRWRSQASAPCHRSPQPNCAGCATRNR